MQFNFVYYSFTSCVYERVLTLFSGVMSLVYMRVLMYTHVNKLKAIECPVTPSRGSFHHRVH